MLEDPNPNTPPPVPKVENPLLCVPNPEPCCESEPKVGVFWFARVPKEAVLLLVPPNPNPPVLAAAVPSPNTLPPVEPRGLVKVGAEPNAGTPPNPGDPPKVGGLPNTGAAPKPPALFGLEKPKP